MTCGSWGQGAVGPGGPGGDQVRAGGDPEEGTGCLWG